MRQFQPDRLKDACMIRRVRIGELADKTGISRTTISNLINGKIQDPQKETIASIAWFLKRPEDYFYTSFCRNFHNTTEMTYRSFSARANLDNLVVEAKLTEIQDITQYLFSFIKERNIDIPSDYFVENENDIENEEDIEAIALKIRDYWNLGQSVISNMTTLLENHGIICTRITMPQKIESVNCCSSFDGSDDEVAFVATSNKSTYFRQRFSLAHELGHIVLHHYLDKEDYIRRSKEIEHQANCFASAFLMPYKAFADSVYKRTFSELLDLKKRWGVSMSACARRLKDLYLISDNQYESMNIQLSRKGWRKTEPLDDTIEPEKPYYLEAGYRFLFEKKILSAATVLNQFNLYPAELEDYIGNDDLFIHPIANAEYILK